MNYIRGQFSNDHDLPNAYFLFREENSNEYIVFQPEGQPPVGIQWNNSLSLSPQIKTFSELEVLFLSVADQVIIFSITNGSLKLKLSLHQRLEDVLSVEEIFLLRMETMVITISKTNYAINAFLEFPDVIDSIQVVEKKVKITGISGEVFWIDI